MRFYRPLGHVLARIPLRPDGSIRLTALLAGTGVFARKQLRRAKPWVDGERMKSSDALSFGPNEVRTVALGPYEFTVREDDQLTLAVHKPADVVTSANPEEGFRVIDLLPDWLFSDYLEPIGRLDKETTGLLLLSEDGQLSQRMRHPARAQLRRYEATLARPLEPQRVQEALNKGISLRDGHVVQPRELQAIRDDNLRWKVAIDEGKYHEVRRLFAAMGSHVESLHRYGYGPFILQSAPVDPYDDTEDGIACCTTLASETTPPSIVLHDGLMRIEGAAKTHLYTTLQLQPHTRMIEITVDEHA